MKALKLKNIVVATYFRPGPGVRVANQSELVQVDDSIQYDPDTMIQELFSYKDQLLGIMKTPADQERGMNYEELQKSVDIIRKIKAATGGVLGLEDDMYATLQARVVGTRWKVATEHSLQFV